METEYHYTKNNMYSIEYIFFVLFELSIYLYYDKT